MSDRRRSLVLALTCSILVVDTIAAQAPRGGMQGTPQQAREAVLLRMDAFEMARERGYRLRREITPRVTEFEVRGPSQAVPFNSDGMEEVQLSRRCPPAMRESMPTCLRIDVIEIFTSLDAGGRRAVLSVIPHTFVGPNAAGLVEVGAMRDVTADADIITRRLGGRVVTAIPWPTPRAE